MIAFAPIDANDQLIEADLDTVPYYLGFSWNEAGQFWALSVRDLNRQMLVSGVRVVPLYPLLRQVRRPELPPGELFVYCTAGTALNRVSFLDGSASLWYADTDDMAEIAAYEPPPVVLAPSIVVIPPEVLAAMAGSTPPGALRMDDNSVLTDDALLAIEI